MKLDGKTALVTGAGRGIGRAVALKLASEGARVLVNDLDTAEAEAVVIAIRDAGGAAAACSGSVTDSGFPDRFIDAALREFGVPDIIINNAGYTWDNVIQKMTDEQFQAMLDVHMLAPFRILRAALGPMRDAAKQEKAEGREIFRKVVNISSVAGLFGSPGQISYSGAKMGIVGMTKTLAREWGRHKVNVNCVAFGFIETRLTQALGSDQAFIEVEGRKLAVGVQPEVIESFADQVPLGRTGTPEEAAGAVYLFCIPESNYVSGEVLICGGGALG